jgi:hypothetical protein
MATTGKLNGMDLCRVGENLLIRLLTPIGWREAVVKRCNEVKTLSLPYRDRAKPVWYVEVNKKKVAFC